MRSATAPHPRASEAGIQDLRDAAAEARQTFTRRIEQRGGRVLDRYWLIPACAVEVPPGLDRAALARIPGVAGVFANTIRSPQSAGPTAPPSARALPIRESTDALNHNADAVHAMGVLGDGVTVACVDTSFDSDLGGTSGPSGMPGLGRPHATFYVNGDPANPTGGGLGGSRLLANTRVGIEPADSLLDHGTKVASIAVGEAWNTTASADRGHAPASRLAGYSIADFPSGATELQTMVAAWQNVVADAAALGTRVAVMAFSGTADPLSPEQQAMDAAVLAADLLVTSSGGRALSPGFFHGATNLLACGAAATDFHSVPSFSPATPASFGDRTYRRSSPTAST